jgi:3-deoxy-D-arabino-heptulosonate 7-phosphate (DAHP) synthase
VLLTWSPRLQNDGNFVLVQNGVGAIWHTSTQGNPGARIVMQGDGNLVIYRTNGITAAWATMTFGGGHVLVMQNDGNLVMYGAGGAKWASNTCCR